MSPRRSLARQPSLAPSCEDSSPCTSPRTVLDPSPCTTPRTITASSSLASLTPLFAKRPLVKTSQSYTAPTGFQLPLVHQRFASSAEAPSGPPTARRTEQQEAELRQQLERALTARRSAQEEFELQQLLGCQQQQQQQHNH